MEEIEVEKGKEGGGGEESGEDRENVRKEGRNEGMVTISFWGKLAPLQAESASLYFMSLCIHGKIRPTNLFVQSIACN